MLAPVIVLNANDQTLVRHHVPLGFGTSLLATDVFVHGLNYLMAPGYLTPFINHPIARMIFLLLFVWQFIGFAVLYRIQFHSTRTYLLGCTAFIVLCALPVLMVPMIGPSTMGIMQAMGPVTVSK